MNRFTKTILVELAIIFFLIIIIVKIPSKKSRHAAFESSSLNYEHGASSIPISGHSSSEEDLADVSISRPKGGLSSYEEGSYVTPEVTTSPDPATPQVTEGGSDIPTEPTTADPQDPTADPTPTAVPAGNGKTAKVSVQAVLLRVEPDTRNKLNGLYYVGLGETMEVVSTDVASDDPNCKDWVKVKYKGATLYVEASCVEIE